MTRLFSAKCFPMGVSTFLVLSLFCGMQQAFASSHDTLAASPAASKPVTTPASADDNKTQDSATVEYNKGVELFQIAQIEGEKSNMSGQKQYLHEAIRHFENALKTNSKLVEAQSNIGFAYLTLHDNHRAIANFEKALQINPQHLNTLNGLSTAYAFDNKIDQAITTFNKLTTLDPTSSQYFFNEGSVLQKAGRIAAARQAYEKALKIQPNDQRVLFNMGTLLENQGNLLEAQKYYEKAKGVEIGNTIGLEAIRRLEAIQAAVGQK